MNRTAWRRDPGDRSARTPDTSALSQALAAARPGDQVTVTVTCGTRELTVQVTLSELPGD